MLPGFLFQDMVGYNLNGLQFLQRELEAREGVRLFTDATIEKRKRDQQKRKRDRGTKRAVMIL
jgi:U3 small nucleolar RNA-associated protein 12